MASTTSPGSAPSRPLCTIVTPVGMLGYGFDEAELELGLGLARRNGSPTAIILDSGSTDSGPAKLALGSMTTPRSSYERDLRKIIAAVKRHRVPLLIGSAGGDGSDAHVKVFLDIISELLLEDSGTKLKVIAIYSGINRNVVLEKLDAGKIAGCGSRVPPLTREDVDATPTIVGQMGPEPFVQALTAHPDVDIIIGGRAYDPAPYVAFCAYHALRSSSSLSSQVISLDGRVLGGFTHMGKIMECGGLCALPKRNSAMATIYPDGSFDVRALAADSRCTPTSVAAHTLYEKSRPDILHGPGGYIDLSDSAYEALLDGVSVRVQGTVFEASQKKGKGGGSNGSYTVKLEGAKLVGYRTIFMGSFIDPILISQLDSLLDIVKGYVVKQHSHIKEKWELGFHIYGRDEKNPQNAPPGAVFIVGEALAESQRVATSVASTARIACVHGSYEGQKATSGNFGMGIGGKGDIETGPCAEFSMYHLMELDEGDEEAKEMRGEADSSDNQIEPGETAKEKGGKLFRWQLHWLGQGDRVGEPNTLSDANVVERSEAARAISTVASDEQKIANTTTPPAPKTLGDLATVVRSKNAGPFEITLDLLFSSRDTYNKVKKRGLLNAETIARLYGIAIEDIIWCGFYDQAMAFKVTVPRFRDGKPMISGGFMENDVHGSQKHVPLLNLGLEDW